MPSKILAFAAAALSLGLAEPGLAREPARPADQRAEAADPVRRAFEAVRAELRAHGVISDTASEGAPRRRTTLQSDLHAESDPCIWTVQMDADVREPDGSRTQFQYRTRLDLRELEAARISAGPLQQQEWCCRKSAEVAFATRGRRESIVTSDGESSYTSNRSGLQFADAEAAQRAAKALGVAVLACQGRAGP